MTKHILLAILFFLFVSVLLSQQIRDFGKNHYGVYFIPTSATNIYGIAIGPVGSEVMCKTPYTRYSHGINLQFFGQGLLQVFYIGNFKFKDLEISNDTLGFSLNDSINKRVVHNGLLLSPFGTFTEQVNGISFSCWMSLGKKINGISINIFWNIYQQINGIVIGAVNHTAITKGVQFGLINKTKKLRGFQFGLWNKNEKRAFPIINWNFKN